MPQARLAANQWVIGEVQQVCEEIEKAMADLRFDAAALMRLEEKLLGSTVCRHGVSSVVAGFGVATSL